MKKENKEQMKRWTGKFGNEYVDRNPQTMIEMDNLYVSNYGITRTKLNKEFLDKFNKNVRILEVGCNVGTQLKMLQKRGFEKLYGIELNNHAVELSKKLTKNINIIRGSGFDLPFKDNFFDLIFTSGVLIHINPKDIDKIMKEIYRCSKKFMWGFEYYADKYTEINYRGNKNLLWKANFSKIYLDSFNDLKLLKEKKVKYLNNKNIDVMFLLKKKRNKNQLEK